MALLSNIGPGDSLPLYSICDVISMENSKVHFPRLLVAKDVFEQKKNNKKQQSNLQSISMIRATLQSLKNDHQFHQRFVEFCNLVKILKSR